MSQENMVLVNGTAIPTPSECKPYPNLREDSTENSLGDLIRKIISCRWKLEMKWNFLTPEQMKILMNIKFLKEFSCNFPSPMGIRITKKMYGGDIQPEVVSYNEETGLIEGYKNVTFNFIQTKADKYTGGAY